MMGQFRPKEGTLWPTKGTRRPIPSPLWPTQSLINPTQGTLRPTKDPLGLKSAPSNRKRVLSEDHQAWALLTDARLPRPIKDARSPTQTLLKSESLRQTKDPLRPAQGPLRLTKGPIRQKMALSV